MPVIAIRGDAGGVYRPPFFSASVRGAVRASRNFGRYSSGHFSTHFEGGTKTLLSSGTPLARYMSLAIFLMLARSETSTTVGMPFFSNQAAMAATRVAAPPQYPCPTIAASPRGIRAWSAAFQLVVVGV